VVGWKFTPKVQAFTIPKDPSIFLEGLKMQENQVDRSKNQKIVESNPLALARGLLIPLLFSFSS
jgi:hypothetical protein